MQKITVDGHSDLAKGLADGSVGAEVILTVKTTQGDSIYRGMLKKWTVRPVNEGHQMEIDLQDWNEYWGEVAARRYYA